MNPLFQLQLSTSSAAVRDAAVLRLDLLEELEAADTFRARATRIIRQRLSGGTLFYPDGKTPCPCGPNADSVAAGRSHDLDPNYCLLSGGPWVQPMWELPIGCGAGSGERLVWFDLGNEAQGLLRKLVLLMPERGSQTWQVQLRWFEAVMWLASLVGVSTNLRPFAFMLSSANTYMAPPGEPRRDWGVLSFHPWKGPMDRLIADVRRAAEREQNQPGRRQRTVVMPYILPTYLASGSGIGWNGPATCADSLYAKLLAGDNLLDFDGFVGCNAGQVKVSGFHGLAPYYTKPTSDGCAFAFPYATLDRKRPNTARDDGQAVLAVKDMIAMSAAERRSLWFETTVNSFRDVEAGYYYGFQYSFDYHSNQNEIWNPAWAPTARLAMKMARAWGAQMANIDLLERVTDASYCYVMQLLHLMQELERRGMPTTLRTSDVLALAGRLQAAKREELSAMIGTQAGALALVNGLVAAIAVLVYTVLMGGLVELIRALRSPRGTDLWYLVMQPLTMRTPESSSGCSFSPDVEGGVLQLTEGFIAGTDNWAPLRDLARGQDAPPPLQDSVNLELPPPPSADDGLALPLLAGGAVAAAIVLIAYRLKD